jgi:hypothetical protein
MRPVKSDAKAGKENTTTATILQRRTSHKGAFKVASTSSSVVAPETLEK